MPHDEFHAVNLKETQKGYVPLGDRFKSFPVNREIKSDQELFLLNKIAGYNEKATLDLILKTPPTIRKEAAIRNKRLPLKLPGLIYWFDAQRLNGVTLRVVPPGYNGIMVDESSKSNHIRAFGGFHLQWTVTTNDIYCPFFEDAENDNNLGIVGDAQFTLFFVGAVWRDFKLNGSQAFRYGDPSTDQIHVRLSDETNGNRINVEWIRNNVSWPLQLTGAQQNAFGKGVLLTIKSIGGGFVTGVSWRVNGIDVAPLDTTGYPTTPNNFIDSKISAAGGGSLGELIICNEVLDDTLIEKVEKYLLKRWNIKKGV